MRTSGNASAGIWIKITDDINETTTRPGSENYRMTFSINSKKNCLVITHCEGVTLSQCAVTTDSLLSNVPEDHEKVWTFQRTREELIVTCNGVIVWHKRFAEISPSCAENMNLTMVKVYFEDDHSFTAPTAVRYQLTNRDYSKCHRTNSS